MPRQLSKGCDYRGAQLGRANRITEPEYPVKLHIERLRWFGDYDRAGAYFGHTWGTWIFHAWGDAAEAEQEVFTRAGNLEEAKSQILCILPNATFYHSKEK